MYAFHLENASAFNPQNLPPVGRYMLAGPAVEYAWRYKPFPNERNGFSRR